MNIKREITVKSILSKSGIPGSDYCINPYIGCEHACRYCYATFMKKYTGHTEPWGHFVDIKINAPELLQRQMKRARKGDIILSSVTDAYQPVEASYKLTRRLLEVLVDFQFPVDILTKSPLVLRDVDLLKRFKDIGVGITITTENDRIRKIFEPRAPSIEERIHTLQKLFEQGVYTYAFIGPILPMNPDVLSERIRPYVHSVFIDRMNYISKSKDIYNSMRMTQWLDKGFLDDIVRRLKKGFSGLKINLC